MNKEKNKLGSFLFFSGEQDTWEQLLPHELIRNVIIGFEGSMKKMNNFKSRMFEFPLCELDNFQPDGKRADLTKVRIQSLKILKTQSTYPIPLEIYLEGIATESPSLIIPPHKQYELLSEQLLDRHLIHEQRVSHFEPVPWQHCDLVEEPAFYSCHAKTSALEIIEKAHLFNFQKFRAIVDRLDGKSWEEPLPKHFSGITENTQCVASVELQFKYKILHYYEKGKLIKRKVTQ